MRIAPVLLLALLMGVDAQAADLLPQQVKDGVLFQCVTNATIVYLAGDFNDWAHNQNGRITDHAFAMEAPDSHWSWSKVVNIGPGLHRFKFNRNGQADGWFTPDWATELDGNSNVLFRVTASGAVIVHSARNPQWQPQISDNRVVLRFYAPQAHLVYLAGDFNNWAGNHDGLVFDPQHVMQGPDSNGVWQADIKLPAGRHVYQFVIDGDHWTADPNAITNSPDGHSILDIR